MSRYEELFEKNILAEWGQVALDEVKTLKVERWLKSLTCVNAAKAKFRAALCLLFNHAIRSELTDRNSISGAAWGAGVRQSSLRSREPDILTLRELRAIIHRIGNGAVRTMTLVAASTAMRRSEILGLKWKDLDYDKRRFGLKRGVVHNMRLPMKACKPGDSLGVGGDPRTESPFA